MRCLPALLLLTAAAYPQDPARPTRKIAPQPPAAQSKPEDLATLNGIVKHSVTSEPVPKASISLFPVDPRPGTQMAPATTTTNAEGRFAMKNLEPGRYRLSASKPGFVNTELGARTANQQGATVTLEKGQSLTGLEIKLSPHSIVTGRITDEDGDPVAYAQVSLVRYRYFQGRKQAMPTGFAQTNDLGEYRIFGIGPGKYFLSASVNRGGYMNTVDRSALPIVQESNAPTYYPNAPDTHSATQLNVPLAGKLDSIDVRLRREKTFRIRGKVAGIGSATQGGMINLIRKDGSSDVMGADRNSSQFRGPSGEFEIRGVRPGSYLLRAMYFEPPDIQRHGTIPLEVSNTDVENLTVSLAAPIELRGSIRAEADTQPALDTLSLYLESRLSRSLGGGMARVKQGAFEMLRIAPDHYDLRINGLPPGYYIKSIRNADIDVKENGLDLSAGASQHQLEIILSPEGAQLEGAITDAKDNPVSAAAIVLRPKSGKDWDLAQMRPVTSDQQGKFQIQGIAPGEYHLIAFTNVDTMEAMDPDFFKEHESKAATIKLSPSARESRQLKAIAIEQ